MNDFLFELSLQNQLNCLLPELLHIQLGLNLLVLVLHLQQKDHELMMHTLQDIFFLQQLNFQNLLNYL